MPSKTLLADRAARTGAPSTPSRDWWLTRAGLTAVLFGVFSALLALTWTRLEVEQAATEDIMRMVGLAAIPVLGALFVRGRFARLAWLLVVAGAGLVALADAFGLPLADARPRDAGRGFFGPLWESFEIGLRGYYETRVTFDPIAHPEMESIVLFAIFGFAAAATSTHVAAASTAVVPAERATWPRCRSELLWSAQRSCGSRPLGSPDLALEDMHDRLEFRRQYEPAQGRIFDKREVDLLGVCRLVPRP